MRNSLKAFIVVLGILTGAAIAVAAPQTSYERNLFPDANDTYDLGSTTPAYEWNSLYSRQVCISGDCKTAWPVGGGSGSPGGSAGSIQINQAGNFGGISTSTLLKSVATSTSVLYINGNRTDTYTADGSNNGSRAYECSGARGTRNIRRAITYMAQRSDRDVWQRRFNRHDERVICPWCRNIHRPR